MKVSTAVQDVVFSVANARAMIFVGGGARDWNEWALFLGLVRTPNVKVLQLVHGVMRTHGLLPSLNVVTQSGLALALHSSIYYYINILCREHQMHHILYSIIWRWSDPQHMFVAEITTHSK